MKKILLIGFLLFGFSFTVLAGETVHIKVKGMVCSFCAQGITKKFKAGPSVGSVKVSLKDKWVDLKLKDGAVLDDKEIQKIINDAGYNVEEIRREPK